MKLFPKLVVFTLIIAIIPLAVVGMRLVAINQDALQTNILEGRAELCSSLAVNIGDRMQNIEKNITTAVYNRSMKELTDEKQKTFLEFLLSQYASEVSQLALMDKDGKLAVHVVDINLGETLDMASEFLESVKVKEALEEKKSFYSDPYISGIEPEPRVSLAIPLIGGTGALAVEVKLGYLQELLAEKTLGRRGFFYLVDKNGKLIAHKDKNRALNREDFSKVAIVKSFMASGSFGSDRFEDPSGERMLGAYSAVAKLGWGIMAQEPEADALATVRVMRAITFNTGIITIVIAVIAGLLFSRTLVGPVYELVKGTRAYSAGNLEYQIPVKSKDEIGDLVRSFSDMGGSLLQRNREIANINEMAKILGSLLDKGQLIEASLSNLKSLIACEVIEAYLTRKDALMLSGSLGESTVSPKGIYPIGALSEVLRHVCENKMPALLNKVEEKSMLLKGVRSLMAIPVEHKGELKGLLLFKNAPEEAPFTEEHLEFAEIIVSSMGISLVNIELLEAMVEKVRMEGELHTAELVQNTLFPKSDPIIPQMDLSGFIQSASETGGDWYGYIPSKDNITILIGDVTGHGVPAALVTAAANSFFKTLEQFQDRLLEKFSDLGGAPPPEDSPEAANHPLSPANLLKILNRVIAQTAEGKLVMTFFISTYYFKTRELVYANAGHNPPLIYRKPEGEEEDPGGGSEEDDRAARRAARMAARRSASKGKIAALPEKPAAASGGEAAKQPQAEEEDARAARRAARMAARSASNVDSSDKAVEGAGEEQKAGEEDSRAARRAARMAASADAAEEGTDKPAASSNEEAKPAEEDPRAARRAARMAARAAATGGGADEENDGAEGQGARRRRGGANVSILKAKGVRLGETKEAEFIEKRTVLNPGDIILWFTDGVIECTNPEGEEYGNTRLREHFNSLASKNAKDIKEAVLDKAFTFFNGHPHKDDITVVVGKVPLALPPAEGKAEEE